MNPAPPDGPAEAVPVMAPQLRALRRRAALTLEAAARTAVLSPAHLSRLETGQRQPSLPMLLALARTYGTTVSELLGEMAADRDAVIRAEDMEPTRAGGWTYWAGRRPAGGRRRCGSMRAARTTPRASSVTAIDRPAWSLSAAQCISAGRCPRRARAAPGSARRSAR
ncbi:hypothetical protein SFUMM280S_09072 [Streptomyces fumanus]